MIRAGDPIGRAIFALWAVGAVVVAIERPGFLLEAATAGIAGTLLWGAMRESHAARPVLVLATGCALVPLMNTWPARVYHAAWESRSLVLAAVLSLSSIILVAIFSIVRPRVMPRWSLPAVVGVLAVSAAAVSSVAADDSAGAAAGAWLAIIVPIALAVIVAAVVRSLADARLVLTALLAGALVPATAGIAAYVLRFGIPWTPTDLAEAKGALFRTHLFQEITFGNVSHLADFALLLLPAALLLPFDRRSPRSARIVAALAAAELTLSLVLVLSRSALMIAVTILAATAGLAALRRSAAALLPAGVSLLFVALLLSPPVRGTLTPPAQPGGPTESIGGVSIFEPSAVTRIEAAEAGLRIARDHFPWGVGSGRYLDYDPVHTAPHSLWIQVFAELGVLGLAALVLIAAVVASGAWWLVRRPHLGSRELLLGSAVAGCAAYLAHGIAAGAPLAVGRVNVWAMMLALLVMLASRTAHLEES